MAGSISIKSKLSLLISGLWYSLLMFLPNEFSRFRVSYYNKKGCKIHKNTQIAPNVRIKGKFEMGGGSSIAQNCSISGEKSGVFIGANVMIAPNVVIVAFNHGFRNTKVPMVTQIFLESPVYIEDDVWIASNCTIGKGVRIGKGAIVGANSFVNKSIPAYSVAAGVPAKIITTRKS